MLTLRNGPEALCSEIRNSICGKKGAILLMPTHTLSRTATRAIIGEGGVYSYIHVLSRLISFESTLKKVICKEIGRAEHECINIYSPQLTCYLRP